MRRLALIAVLLSSPALAQPQISRETLQWVTQQLSSDAFEGRAPGTQGEARTVELIAQEFQRAGLQPGNNGSWFQDVPLVEITLQGSPQLRIAGGSGAPTAFAYRTDFVGTSYRAQPRVAVENSDIVFVGYGINAPERGWNDYEGVDVRGKTVVILVNDPDWSASGLEGPFGGRAMTYYGRWTYKFEEAARQGAAAALIVHDTAPASYGWNVVENSWTGPQPYMQTPNDGADQTAMNGWLSHDAARRLLAAGGQDLDALSRAAAQRGFRAVPLAGLRASVTLDNQVRRFASRNVVGILPGTSRGDEYVLYTAHWDHLGICREEGPSTPPAASLRTGEDRICNGATDNASGTAALVALAEANARTGATSRSQVFVAVTAEESGLLGSAYYAANPIYPLSLTAGGINIDSLQLAGDARDAYAVGAGKSELDAYLQRAARAENLTLTPEPAPEAGYYYRSDHFSLAKRGVPMVYAKLGPDLVNGGRTAGLAAQEDYRANRYHAPGDEYDPAWNWDGAVHEVRLLYRIGRELAESEAWPNWNQGDEFRAIRDRSRAEQLLR
ncbi:M28 family metallopeptidase [Sphingosinicella sp. LHD-64]|uniref:M28 family metallopeptidase n=1 Tax=Sphingosinicella sp. LHD-64 TaxID=3072139 RepID=UPI00280E143B|nr:M28 family metallopeptidase [Sphingosinicella sp. LHD-64]MDQ8755070.1 M28 family metallopeptidase [Sphingosinicella sp. LHD-64]